MIVAAAMAASRRDDEPGDPTHSPQAFDLGRAWARVSHRESPDCTGLDSGVGSGFEAGDTERQHVVLFGPHAQSRERVVGHERTLGERHARVSEPRTA